MNERIEYKILSDLQTSLYHATSLPVWLDLSKRHVILDPHMLSLLLAHNLLILWKNY